MTFEWFPIPLPHTFKLGDKSNIGVASEKVKISRDQDLRLVVEANAAGEILSDEEPIPGTQSIGATLQLEDNRGQIIGFKRLKTRTETEDNTRHCYVSGQADAISLTISNDESTSITEWLTNVPRLLWPDSTDRTRTTSIRRQRDGSDVTDEKERAMAGSDYLQLNLNLPTLERVLIGTVPQEFVTEGTQIVAPGFIQYFRGPDGLPNDSLRNTVLRAFEFLFGSGLGVLGHCQFASNGRPVTAVYKSSYIPGGIGSGHRPALLHAAGWIDGLDRTVVTPVVRRYIELEPSCHLNRAVWLYLHGRNAPLEMAAGYVGAAFEVIRRGYYNQPENEPRSRLMPKERWQTVGKEMQRLLSDISKTDALQGYTVELQEIERRFAELNKVSGTRLNRLFLTDLALQHGETEMQALQARNNDAHALPFNTAEAFEKLRSYRALHTLFARALLRMLSAQVFYFDYSSLGHPLKRLEEKQGDSK